MAMPNCWKVICMEKQHPGLWRTWFREQAVAVGWHSKWWKEWTLDKPTSDRTWSRIRSDLKSIEIGDLVVVHLAGNRVGRVGEVVRKRIRDTEWEPLVPISRELKQGDQGRRVIVRWTSDGPHEPDEVVQLPPKAGFSGFVARLPLCRLRQSDYRSVVSSMRNESNWVKVASHHFRHEISLSDYLGTFPQQLEQGLVPYPSQKVREKVFKDGGRADVLLMDDDKMPVVVECKQNAPTPNDVAQLRRYMRNASRVIGKRARGILVHGGARLLSPEVRKASARAPRIDTLRYQLAVDLSPSA